MTHSPYCECRTYGHAWFEVDADKKSPIGWYLWLKCERCGMIRMDTVDVHGELSARSYRRPPNYRTAGRITRPQWRQALRRKQRAQARRKVAA